MSANVASQWGWYQIGRCHDQENGGQGRSCGHHEGLSLGHVRPRDADLRGWPRGHRRALDHDHHRHTSTTSTAIATLNRPVQQGPIT
jgi:hypothetical protein